MLYAKEQDLKKEKKKNHPFEKAATKGPYYQRIQTYTQSITTSESI